MKVGFKKFAEKREDDNVSKIIIKKAAGQHTLFK